MITRTMTLEEFETLLDARGPDIGTWPRRKQRAAERLLARSAEVRAPLDAARALDTDIADLLQPAAIGADLRARLDAIALNHPHRPAAPRDGLPPLRRWWYAGAATAMASVVAGFVVGATIPPASETPDEINLAGLVYGPSNGGLLP